MSRFDCLFEEVFESGLVGFLLERFMEEFLLICNWKFRFVFGKFEIYFGKVRGMASRATRSILVKVDKGP